MAEDQVVNEVVTDSQDAPVIDEAKLEVEKEARLQGWVPKEEFRGKETDWIDAEIFVQRGREINPILRKNNERIQKELEKAKKDLEELRISVEEFKKFQKEAHEKKVSNLEAELVSLREQKKAAITAGDGDLAVALDEQIDAVKDAKQAAKDSAKEEKKETKEVTPPSPKVQEWIDQNSWYNSNRAMTLAADTIANEIRAKNPFLDEEKFLEAVDKELEETFPPEKLGRKVKPRSPVEGASTSTKTNKSEKNSYDSLPADAKAACDAFIKQGLIKNREEYVKEYFS